MNQKFQHFFFKSEKKFNQQKLLHNFDELDFSNKDFSMKTYVKGKTYFTKP